MLTTFGVEEETMLVDPVTLRPVDAGAAYRLLSGAGATDAAGVGPYVSREYLAAQLEFSSPVYTGVADAERGLGAFRSAVGAAARRTGAMPWNGGVPFDAAEGPPAVTASARYAGIALGHGAVVDDHQISALHVHVGVPDRATGVRALNAVRPWLPVLLALGANSPFGRGRDTGFASWRSILMRRWTTSGSPPAFADEHDYAVRLARLVGVGGTADTATVAWNLRLSERHPTLEFRVFDAQLVAGDSLLLAAICRALVNALLDAPAASPAREATPPELLDAALWHASRDGLGDRLVHPVTGALAPAAEVVDALRQRIRPAARSLGDAGLVEDGLDRLLRDGPGATRQRAAHAAAGLDGLRALALTPQGSNTRRC